MIRLSDPRCMMDGASADAADVEDTSSEDRLVDSSRVVALL